MTAPETPDELRARLNELAEVAVKGPWRCWAPGIGGAPGGIWAGAASGGANVLVSYNADLDDLAFIVALVNAWPAIDALLARLTAAEAIVQRAETVIVGHGLEGDEHAYRTLQMILALRERPQ